MTRFDDKFLFTYVATADPITFYLKQISVQPIKTRPITKKLLFYTGSLQSQGILGTINPLSISNTFYLIRFASNKKARIRFIRPPGSINGSIVRRDLTDPVQRGDNKVTY